MEMKGGGPPEELKENISGDAKKILELLDKSLDLDLTRHVVLVLLFCNEVEDF